MESDIEQLSETLKERKSVSTTSESCTTEDIRCGDVNDVADGDGAEKRLSTRTHQSVSSEHDPFLIPESHNVPFDAYISSIPDPNPART